MISRPITLTIWTLGFSVQVKFWEVGCTCADFPLASIQLTFLVPAALTKPAKQRMTISWCRGELWVERQATNHG